MVAVARESYRQDGQLRSRPDPSDHRQEETLRLLVDASRELARTSTLGEQHRAIVRHGLALLGAQTCLLATVQGDLLVVRQAVGRQGSGLRNQIIPLRKGILRDALREEPGLLVTGEAAALLGRQLALESPPLSAALVALHAGSAGSALLIALAEGTDAFQVTELRAFRLLGQLAALALDRGHLLSAHGSQAEALDRIRDQLVHSARLATVGQLSAVMLHEINNPLQSVLGAVQIVLEGLPADAPDRLYLEVAARELDRVAEIARRTVGFYRGKESGSTWSDVNILVRDTLVVVEKRLLRNQVDVVLDLRTDLPAARIAPDQLKQVFLNLVLNAAEAMTRGGRLTIATRRRDASAVEIAFSDAGPGLGPRELERVFEPFYTTKPEGTGLGLSISREIVNQHDGALLAESQVGHGATFRVILPAS